MAAPVLSATTDKPSYAPGELVTLTVTRSDPDSRLVSVALLGTDSAANSTPLTVEFGIADPVTLAMTGDGGLVWTLGSDDGTTTVYTATA